MYSDSQNYVYSDKFFLSQPLAVEKKGGGIWKNLFELDEQASECKKINFAPCKVKKFLKHSQIYENTNK